MSDIHYVVNGDRLYAVELSQVQNAEKKQIAMPKGQGAHVYTPLLWGETSLLGLYKLWQNEDVVWVQSTTGRVLVDNDSFARLAARVNNTLKEGPFLNPQRMQQLYDNKGCERRTLVYQNLISKLKSSAFRAKPNPYVSREELKGFIFPEEEKSVGKKLQEGFEDSVKALRKTARTARRTFGKWWNG
jgi:hypothetical protein